MERQVPDIGTLIGQRRRILETKLAVFAGEIRDRLDVRTTNLESLLDDEMKIRNQILTLPKNPFGHVVSGTPAFTQYQQNLLQIDQQRRDEEVQCWRDVVQVMRDFLMTWEALEQSKARGSFLHGLEDKET